MVKIKIETKINKPPEEVFEYAADLSGYNRWMPTSGLFIRCEKTSKGSSGPDTAYYDKTRLGNFQGKIVRYEKPGRLEFRQQLSHIGVKVMESCPGYTFEPEEGGTRVYHYGVARLSGIFKIFIILYPVWLLMARAERKRTLYGLKRAVESGM